MHIITNGGPLFKDLSDAVKAWKSNDFYSFGYDISDIVYRVLIK